MCTKGNPKEKLQNKLNTKNNYTVIQESMTHFSVRARRFAKHNQKP